MTATMKETTTARKLETTTCSRCCGTGNYSYCPSYGTTCFKCCGRKVVYTKRGQAARNYLETIRSKPVEEIKVGDMVQMSGCTMGGSVYDAWVTIKAISTDIQEGASLRDGVMVPYRMTMTRLDGMSKYGAMAATKQPGSLVRVAQNKEQAVATLDQAIAYQATLTLAGTPRKRTAK